MELFTFWHLVILAVVALVLFFGWKQLPDMARSLGRSLRVFKTEIKGMSEDDRARENASGRADDERAQDKMPLAIEPPAVTASPAGQPASRPRPAPSPQRRVSEQAGDSTSSKPR